MEERIRNAVKHALAHLGADGVTFTVERPLEMGRGDYMTNAAMIAAKQVKKNPQEVAHLLTDSLTAALGASVTRVDVAGPGFINIALARDTITATLAEASTAQEEWGKGRAQEGSRVMVEYTDPNPFKEMHIGHLMSNTIGEAVARLIQNSGASIARANYQGDVGPHVAKAIWGLQQANITEPSNAAELGAAYARGAKAYEESPEAKSQIDELNKQIYIAHDHALMELWRKGREISLAAFEDLYRILGTKFDYYFFESEVAESGARIVRDGVSSGIFEESEGAVIYRGEEKGLHTLVFITSKGTPTYEAKEIGLAFLKEERWPADRSLIATAAEQVGHFKVVKAALEDVAPLLGAKTEHIAHGFLRLTSGKMSSREGNVITASGLIRDITEKASEKNPDPLIAEQVALGAIKYMILRQAPGSDIVFDPEQSLSLEGDSGPYLQYALVRARSVIEKANKNAALMIPVEPYLIERVIIHYPEIAARAASDLAPNLLINYLTELAAAWNAFYAAERIVGDTYEAYKVTVAQAFVETMINGLRLLGIPTPEQM
jgi:arginyl-tRNA synthetase